MVSAKVVNPFYFYLDKIEHKTASILSNFLTIFFFLSEITLIKEKIIQKERVKHSNIDPSTNVTVQDKT
jgi:hypothetical protein